IETFRIKKADSRDWEDIATGQTVEYIQVEGAGHAFFDWKPDARTKETFKQYGVPYAAQMKDFFDTVFYPDR
ncbi:hypothetical protein ACFLZ8_05835, partial [Planctomycetota bacterium]